jgi:hypothetical protein
VERYVFRTGRSSTQDAVAAAVWRTPQNAQIAMLAQDYAFGRDGVKAVKESAGRDRQQRRPSVHEEYVPQATTDFTGARAAHVSMRSRIRAAPRSSASSGPAASARQDRRPQAQSAMASHSHRAGNILRS